MAEKFGTRLARLRKQAGFNQGGFAKDVGVRQSFISMLETEGRAGERVQGGTLLRMARKLGVSMEYLLTGRHQVVPQRKKNMTDVGIGDDHGTTRPAWLGPPFASPYPEE